MRCEIHCPLVVHAPVKARGPLGAAVGVFAAAVVVLHVLAVVWPLLLGGAAVLAVVTAAAAWALAKVGRWSQRLSVVYWPARARVRAPAVVTGELVRAPYQIPAPPLAIEQAPARVLEGVIIIGSSKAAAR